jgi:hypothetical protein
VGVLPRRAAAARARPRDDLAAGLEDPDAGVIRLDPWRLKAAAAAALASGEPAHVWHAG